MVVLFQVNSWVWMLTVTWYCLLWSDILCLPKFHMLIPNQQGDDIHKYDFDWSFCPQSGAFSNRISALLKHVSERPSGINTVSSLNQKYRKNSLSAFWLWSSAEILGIQLLEKNFSIFFFFFQALQWTTGVVMYINSVNTLLPVKIYMWMPFRLFLQ